MKVKLWSPAWFGVILLAALSLGTLSAAEQSPPAVVSAPASQAAQLVDVSATGRDPVRDFEVIIRELDSFSPALRQKPMTVVANKIDLLDLPARPDLLAGGPARLEQLRAFCAAQQLPCLAISALTGAGLAPLIQHLAARLRLLPRAAPAGEQSVSGDKTLAKHTPSSEKYGD